MKRVVVVVLVLVGMLVPSRQSAAELNKTKFESRPEEFMTAGSVAYFTAEDAGGRELWKTNGTGGGTVKVKDINPGGSSNPDSLTVIGSTLYFSADDGSHGRELWRTDGTSAGTTMVKDVRLGSHVSSMIDGHGVGFQSQQIAAVGSSILFAASDGVKGMELWRTNGTSAGTALVKDIYLGFENKPCNCGSSPGDLTSFAGKVFFSAATRGEGVELWSSDGTAGGTSLVKDLDPRVDGGARSDGAPDDLTVVGTKLFFNGGNSLGRELWRSDGTTAGTIMVKDLQRGSGLNFGPGQLTAVAGVLYYVDDDGTHGSELFRSDGTVAGTFLVSDIRTGGNASNPGSLTAFGSKVAFSASGVAGTELWTSDGSASGTTVVKDVFPGSTSSSPFGLAVAGTTLYFHASDGLGGADLWRSDGTSGGTTKVKDLPIRAVPNVRPGVLGSAIVFPDDLGLGIELVRSDGTDAGTAQLKDIFPGGGSSIPGNLTPFGSQLLLTAVLPTTDPAQNVPQLYRTDAASPAGMTVVKSIASPSASWGVPTVVGSTAFMAAGESATGIELWKTDGTTAGTVLVKDRAGPSGLVPTLLRALGSKVFFTADDGTNGRELWVSDGTTAGTKMVKDIKAGSSSSNPDGLYAAGSNLYFSADDGSHGRELWRTDGTTTVLVADILPGTASSNPTEMKLLGSFIYFAATDASFGRELWRSNGLTVGAGGTTVMVHDVRPGSASSDPVGIAVSGSKVFFSAFESDTRGRELWVTDGTDAGTTLVKDIATAIGASSNPALMTAFGTGVLFQANDGSHGTELWFSDGTAAGTIQKDLSVAKGSSSNPSNFVVVGSNAYFSAADPSGRELWRIDSAKNVLKLQDIFPGAGSSSPTGITTAVGPYIYFTADDGANGRELWRSNGNPGGATLV